MSDDKAFKKITAATGRPTKCCREIIQKISKTLLSGAYIETACALHGVSKDTLKYWAKQGREGPDSIHGEFLAAVSQAEAECEARDLYNIDRAAMGQDWDYERWDGETPDDNGFVHKAGVLRLNGRGNPIVKKIGMAPQWNASAWRLERKHPKRWARTEKLEHSGKGGGPQVIVTLPSNGREAKKDDGSGTSGDDKS